MPGVCAFIQARDAVPMLVLSAGSVLVVWAAEASLQLSTLGARQCALIQGCQETKWQKLFADGLLHVETLVRRCCS